MPIKDKPHKQLKAKGIPYALMVSAAVILCAEDPRSRNGAEDTQIENENELIGHGDAGHLHGAYPPYHYVVKHIDKVSDAVLYHYGNGNSKNSFIKGSVTKQIFDQLLSPY